ncbi:DUF3180 domain-containing protein [Embleya sp. AB8]|uniref:DUF3180 domain-containing protein n=1 Tax=Embleya sp. AB8 TaxID=3156304 RepID=UPI003C73C72B
MKPTRPLVLLALALGAGGIAYAGIDLWDSRGTPPVVPILAPIVLLCLAAIALATAISLRSRLKAQRERRPTARPVDPLVAARAVVFAKAGSLVGALVVGLYGGYALYLSHFLEVTERAAQAERCALSVGAGALLIGACLFLERILRVPEDPKEK